MNMDHDKLCHILQNITETFKSVHKFSAAPRLSVLIHLKQLNKQLMTWMRLVSKIADSKCHLQDANRCSNPSKQVHRGQI